MRTLYMEPFAGIAGDMLLGALIDLGVNVEMLSAGLATLGIEGLAIRARRRVKDGMSGMDVSVTCDGEDDGGLHCHAHSHVEDDDDGHRHDHSDQLDHAGHDAHQAHHLHHGHRGLREILDLIGASSLSERVKTRASRAFDLLAEAESAVHGLPKEAVHFHEVGAWDSIADLVGCFLAVELLDIDRVVSAPVNVGSGTVDCAHGRLPVPAPATARLLEGVPVYAAGAPCERTTPTGALMLRLLVEEYGTMPKGVIVATGIGHGDRDTGDANFLRVMLIEEGESTGDYLTGDVATMETNVDDMNPQDWPPLVERLFERGALDVFLTQIMMKKGRPGVRLTCVVRPADREALGRLILEHSTTLGLRWRVENRMTLRRSETIFESSLGPIGVKKALLDGQMVHESLEFEDLKAAAQASGLPLDAVRRQTVVELGRNEATMP